MEKQNRKKLNMEQGSATIEALVGFTAFLFAIFTILGMTNFCRAQMMVSAAMDTAAKEMSQYAYFYKMSGLQKFEGKLDNNAEVGKKNINEVIGTVDDLYASFNGAVEQTVQDQTDVANMLAAGEVELSGFENAISNLDDSVSGVMQGINSVTNAIGDIGNDPLKYMRSLVAIIGSETMEVAKRAIAVPLTKCFVSKHFGETTEEANEKLESLGIEGGLDSMNFNLSKIFADKNQEKIELVVFYKVKLFQVYDWVVLEANVSKVASCLAWLGGDKVETTVKVEQPQTSEDSTEEEKTTTEETTTEVSTDLWALPQRSEDGYFAVQGPAFYDLMGETYGFEPDSNSAFLLGHNGSTAYACTNLADSDGLLFGMAGDQKSWVAYNAYYSASRALKEAEKYYDPDASPARGQLPTYKPGEVTSLVYVVYVPENISDDALNQLIEDCKVGTEACKAQGKEALGRELDVNISFVKAGGNYGYGSEGK